MASIINGFNPNLPAQNRIRVRLTHHPSSCEVYFDFDEAVTYSLNGKFPGAGQPTAAARARILVPYSKQIQASPASGGYYTAWAPPPDVLPFRFDEPPERPPCSNGDNDIRIFDGRIRAYSSRINASSAYTIVYVKDTNTICEDVGMFYAFDGADPDPCPDEDVCILPDHPLDNALVNYEVLTAANGRRLWITAKAASTQVGSGPGCVENYCTESIDGSAWRA